jgi:hypothetical protein
VEEDVTLRAKSLDQEKANTMNDWPLPSSRLGMIIGFFVLSIFFVGCGAVGPPIPPEDVGIEAKVRKQQRATAIDHDATLEEPAAVIEEEAVELPALYPIGTR